MKKYYSKQNVWSLFLVCAFPLHLWTLILAFRDISWVAERTNFWDAIGVLSYGLIFALFESIIIFVPALLSGILIPIVWGRDKRLGIISSLVLILALWAMCPQLYALLSWNIPDWFIRFLVASAHPLRNIYIIALAFIVPSMILPTLMIYRSEKAARNILDAIDRISLLTSLYLFFDIIAIIIVVIRNV